MSVKVADRVMIHMPGEVKGRAWKFARPFRGPYRVISVTPTNVEAQLVDNPTNPPIFVSLSRVRPCYPELSNIVWTGHDRRKERNKKTTKADPVVPPERSDDYTGPVTHLRSRRAGQ